MFSYMFGFCLAKKQQVANYVCEKCSGRTCSNSSAVFRQLLHM